MNSLSTLSPAIRSYLDDYVAQARRIALLRRVAIAISLFVLWMMVWCAADRFLHLPRGVRVGALASGAFLALGSVLWKLAMLLRRTEPIQIAEAIERQDPRFNQRLVTVASRVLGSSGYRGSDQMLLRLARELDEQLANERARRKVPARPAIAAWLICLPLLLGTAALLKAPDLRFADLARRFFEPLADVPPVTTTQLIVQPGDQDIIQSQPVNIDVQASRVGDSAIVLFLNQDGREWSRILLTPSGTGHAGFALPGIDRDLHYYVTAGDARSREFVVRVLRRPAVAQFRIRYEFPSYTRLSPSTVVNTDGRIDAPAGTRVALTITATEPLKAALITIGSDRILMDRGADEYSRKANLTIAADAKYSLDLISTRDVAGAGPTGTAIHAEPDLPPQIRLARGGDSLRLNPREIVPVWYEAIDDYALTSLSLRADVNGKQVFDSNIPIWGDPRRQQDVFNFDLATLPLGMGDVVNLTAYASDSAGHVSHSLPLQVVISPRSIDLDAYERISELHNSAQFARSLTSQLDDAVKAQNEAAGTPDHQSPAYVSATSRQDRSLSAAAQTAILLRQSLLRAMTHTHLPRICAAVSAWIDAAERESTWADDAFRQSGTPGGLTPAQRERLTHALDQARQLQSQLDAAQQGEEAGALLADHLNLQATQKRTPPKDENGRRRLRETIDRMRQDIATEAGRIKLDAGAGDFEAQLRSRIHAEQDAIDASKPVNFVAAAREWVAQLQQNPEQRQGFAGRLSAAAQAEAIRPNADLARARDLELASRAAAALAGSVRNGTKPPAKTALNQFVTDLLALARDRQLERKKDDGSAASLQAARDQAETARQDLARMAGDAPRTAIVSAEDRQRDAENLALAASAAAADHQYQQAAAIDDALARKLASSPHRDTAPSGAETESSAPGERVQRHEQAVQHEMATARRLDDLGQVQEHLAKQTSSTQPAELAGPQRDVAEQIAQVESQHEAPPDGNATAGETMNGRDRAASEVLSAQEQLSAMPQALAAAQAAAAALRDAAQRARTSQNAARSAPADQRAASERAAAEAQANVREATQSLGSALQPVSAKAAQALAERLEPFAPETDGARAAILGQLVPALQGFEQSAAGDDAGAVDRTSNNARRAMEACQRELSAAQETLVQRDPLAAARWFARAAAQSLSLSPPDVGHARSHQASASAALSRAWDQSIHQAAADRLAAVPSLAPLLDGPAESNSGTGPASSSKFAAAREWGRLRPQDGADLNAPMHDADPPGYEESLKLYFEALGKAQDGK